MLNEIMDAVTRRLNELFGDNYEIYTDAVEQGLKEPCFFVQFLEPSEKPMTGQRYFRKTEMIIQYMAGEPEQLSRENNRVSDLLMDGMEIVTTGDGRQYRGTDKSSRVEDGVLSFFVSYNGFVWKGSSAQDAMGALEVKGEVK